MSAIVGIYYPNGKLVEAQCLSEMIHTLEHRGIDNTGIWIESSIGLGHRMLYTTPESLLEKLPLTSNSKELIITSDARIDNRQELISSLNFGSIPTEKITDSQLILAAYEKWGESCPNRLLGDFTFAIWDKSQQSIFCARDHFGIKPFYYYYSQEAFVFASEIKGLLCVPEVSKKLNEIRVGDFLASTLYDTEQTFYKNIFRLPPAHTVKVSKMGFAKKSYWKLDPEYELKLDSDREYADKFREIFTEAVRCRLRSAYPIGSMLSGGLDSSSVACMAQEILCDQELPTFSSVFKAVPESDESFFINAVVSKGKFQPHYIYGDRVSPLVDIEKALWHQDEPIFACNLYLNWKIYEQADKLRIRVMLDGFDGDNTVSHGVGYLKELAIANRWWKLIVEVKGLTKNFNYPFWKNFWIYLEHYGIKPIIDRYRILRFIWYRYKSLLKKLQAKSDTKSKSWTSILNNQFINKIKIRERRKQFLRERYSSNNSQRYEHYQDIINGLLPTTLEVLDRTAAAYNIEVRYPLWDKRLVEFCLSLPTEQKMQQGWTRMIMRRGMEGILPKEVQWRGGKGNLGHSFEYGLKTFEKENLEEIFKNTKLIEKYINMEYLYEVYQDFMSEAKENNDAMAIWKSANLALWLKSNDICT